MSKLILHVGMHKTATSSFQLTASHNAKILSEIGFLYPIFNVRGRNIVNHSIPIYSLFCENPSEYHINVRWGLDYKSANEVYSSVLAEALNSGSNLLMSGEDISLLSKSALTEFVRLVESYGFEIEVHCVIRSPYSLLCSMVQQNIRGGIDSLSQISIVRVSDTVSKLSSVFDNVNFHSFEELCKSTHGPVLGLFEKMRIDNERFILRHDNEGLGNKTTRLLNYINRYLPSIVNGVLNPERNGVHHFDQAVNCDDQKFLLTNSELGQVFLDLEDENSRLKSSLGSQFCDNGYPTAENFLIDDDFAGNVVERFSGLPAIFKKLAYDFLIIEGYKNRDVLTRFFDSSRDLLDADMLRDTALLWEKKNLDRAIIFMKYAKKCRPHGALINRKLDEFLKLSRNLNGVPE